MPSEGVNCLIGPGDSGKSTILDAIDLCLGVRRNLQLSDADFHGLDVGHSISITLTIGALEDDLKSFESYGLYLRGLNRDTGEVEDEPEKEAETVLSLRLAVESDLEPVWTLISDRAASQDASRNLAWGDRTRLAPTRLGVSADYNLGWRRGSVLNRLTDEQADASAALVNAARQARDAFGENAGKQLQETLKIVGDTARELGVPVGSSVKAMLDTHSVSFSGGTISLHNDAGIPLRGLGTGSTRLLIAGLNRKAADNSAIVLVDEIENGLEPHRIIRLLGSLGAKQDKPPLQVFATTHSPVALRELSGNQLYVVRETAGVHSVKPVGTSNEIQGTIRAYPEAFLAPSVIICEGASEVGFIRGIDQFRTSKGKPSINAAGTALVDAGGVSKIYGRALPLQAGQYRVSAFRDDDQQPSADDEAEFEMFGGDVFKWADGHATEDALFVNLSDAAVGKLLAYAIDIHGTNLINSHILTASDNKLQLNNIQSDDLRNGFPNDTRRVLGSAARFKSSAWFKNVSAMEYIGKTIVGPDLPNAQEPFRNFVEEIFKWAGNGQP